MPKQKPDPTPKLVTLKEANSLLPKVQQALDPLREHRDRNEIGAQLKDLDKGRGTSSRCGAGT